MNKRIVKAGGMAIIAGAINYLLFAFIHLDFDPANWSTITRAIIVVTVLIAWRLFLRSGLLHE